MMMLLTFFLDFLYTVLSFSCFGIKVLDVYGGRREREGKRLTLSESVFV